MKNRLFAVFMISVAALTLSGYTSDYPKTSLTQAPFPAFTDILASSISDAYTLTPSDDKTLSEVGRQILRKDFLDSLTRENLMGTVGVYGSVERAGVMQNILVSADKDFQKIIESLKDNLEKVPALRADPALISEVRVNYYGSPTPIREIANITVQNSNILVISPYDISVLGSIEKAILASGINITPENDGKCIRLRFPQVTGELRRQIIEEISIQGNLAKTQIRNVRKAKLDELKVMLSSENITQDESDNIKSKLQELVDMYNNVVSDTVDKKKNQILEI